MSSDPFNAETDLARTLSDGLTPASLFYVRNHFAVPHADAHEWSVAVDGNVAQPFRFTLDDLSQFPSRSVVATIECAGNGRSAFQPKVDGEPWEYGAVSTAKWAGISLRDVLDRARPSLGTVEILVSGADGGFVPQRGAKIFYERSIPVDMALHPDTLLVHSLNGEPLSPDHGYPLRLVVPGWYGMASVKWVTRISALSRPFDGFYQRDRYVWEVADDLDRPNEPLSKIKVRSVIVSPLAGSKVVAPRVVRGLAWSGEGPVQMVEVSFDGGQSWSPADLPDSSGGRGWQAWNLPWTPSPGAYCLMSRASDVAGEQQPLQAQWNRLGYCNNAVQPVRVDVP